MALTDDQKAMLRLLAQREEGYEDMAALMGISVEELRARVKEALSEVEEPEAAGETKAAAPVPSEAPKEASEPAPPPAPSEPVPAPAPASPSPPRRATARASTPSPLSRLRESSNRGALIGIGLGLLALIGIAIALAVSGSSSSSTTASSEGETTDLVNAIASNPNLTVAILKPTPEGEGEGVAVLGRVKKKVVMDVAAKGLEPSGSGQSYAIWLSHSGEAMVPMGTTDVPSSGELGARLEVTSQVLELIARQAFNQVDVTRVSDKQLRAAIATARKENVESTYTGEPVLSGKITGKLIRAAKRSGG